MKHICTALFCSFAFLSLWHGLNEDYDIAIWTAFIASLATQAPGFFKEL